MISQKPCLRIPMFFFVIAMMWLFAVPEALAEPWLANRYAQNCAACHSPSRRNVAPRERRCTLACQGCHVNPNGGGMRNSYGVWNAQRWVRSYKSKTFGSKGTPAPLKYQKYGKMPEKFTKADAKKYLPMAKKGAPLVVIRGTAYDEKDYDKSDRQEHINVTSKIEQMARMTEDDPYRIERNQEVFAGGDFRYFFFDGEANSSGTIGTGSRKVDGIGPMVFDLGVRLKPMATHKNVNLVFENRYFNNPNSAGQGSLEWTFLGGSQVRSAYVLVDDLPYATYVQAGLYRPLFGLGSPDHTTLLNSLIYADNRNSVAGNLAIQARGAKAINKVLSFGGSPNVPFVNVHWIMPMDSKDYPMSGEHGYALNLGGRFVSYGASIMASYWSTKGKRAGGANQDELKTNMYGVTAGATFGRAVVNVDYSSIEKEFQPGSSDTGAVTTVELKYRLYKEMYAMFNYATANTTRTLKQGESSEMMYGVKSFLLPGTEFELLMINRTDRDTRVGSASRLDTDMLQAQMHLYF